MGRIDSELWTKKLTHAFEGFDADRVGYITAADLDSSQAGITSAFGRSPDSPGYARYAEEAQAWRDAMMNRLDKDGDDRIGLDEFLSFYGNASVDEVADWAEHYVAGLCALADADDDSRLSEEEYIRWVVVADGATEAAAEAAFAALDADGTGYLTRDELAHAMVEFTTSEDRDTVGNELFGAIA